jgi:hypothetical protein
LPLTLKLRRLHSLHACCIILGPLHPWLSLAWPRTPSQPYLFTRTHLPLLSPCLWPPLPPLHTQRLSLPPPLTSFSSSATSPSRSATRACAAPSASSAAAALPARAARSSLAASPVRGHHNTQGGTPVVSHMEGVDANRSDKRKHAEVREAPTSSIC